MPDSTRVTDFEIVRSDGGYVMKGVREVLRVVPKETRSDSDNAAVARRGVSGDVPIWGVTCNPWPDFFV